MIGRESPIEYDALRVLLIVHQLGTRTSRRWTVDSEHLLQQLDHLVRHPIDLAFVVMDHIRHQPGTETAPRDLPARVRRLLDLPPRARHRRAIFSPFERGSWQRWDDVLAFLGCRDLLRISPLAPDDSRFELTERAVGWLETTVLETAAGSDAAESDAAGSDALARELERCALLRTALPPRLLGGRGLLEPHLDGVRSRLTAYQSDEQLDVEDDLIAGLFQATFLEPL